MMIHSGRVGRSARRGHLLAARVHGRSAEKGAQWVLGAGCCSLTPSVIPRVVVLRRYSTVDVDIIISARPQAPTTASPAQPISRVARPFVSPPIAPSVSLSLSPTPSSRRQTPPSPPSTSALFLLLVAASSASGGLPDNAVRSIIPSASQSHRLHLASSRDRRTTFRPHTPLISPALFRLLLL
jgi:hypothetical protein